MEIKLSVSDVKHAMGLWLKETFSEDFEIKHATPTNDGIKIQLVLNVERKEDA